MIDNLSNRQTPEGIELSLMPAGIVPRLGAWLIDALCRLGMMIAVSLVISFFGRGLFGLILIAFFLIEWFYPVLFEVFRGGQTIGKKQFGLVVCQDDGTPIRWQASMLRNLLRTADFLPFAFLGGIVAMLFHKESKRLGDIVAGTLVVYADDRYSDAKIPTASPIALPIPLQLDEQQAILAFAEREVSLPMGRKVELANILTPVVAGGRVGTHDMPNQIIGYANTILGTPVQMVESRVANTVAGTDSDTIEYTW